VPQRLELRPEFEEHSDDFLRCIRETGPPHHLVLDHIASPTPIALQEVLPRCKAHVVGAAGIACSEDASLWHFLKSLPRPRHPERQHIYGAVLPGEGNPWQASILLLHHHGDEAECQALIMDRKVQIKVCLLWLDEREVRDMAETLPQFPEATGAMKIGAAELLVLNVHDAEEQHHEYLHTCGLLVNDAQHFPQLSCCAIEVHGHHSQGPELVFLRALRQLHRSQDAIEGLCVERHLAGLRPANAREVEIQDA